MEKSEQNWRDWRETHRRGCIIILACIALELAACYVIIGLLSYGG